MKLMLFCPCLLSGTFMSVSFISMQHGFFCHCIVFYHTNIPLTSLLLFYIFCLSVSRHTSLYLPGTWRPRGPWAVGLPAFHFPSLPLSPDPDSKDTRAEHASGADHWIGSWATASAGWIWRSNGTERRPQLPAPGDASSDLACSFLILMQWIVLEECGEDFGVRETWIPGWLLNILVSVCPDTGNSASAKLSLKSPFWYHNVQIGCLSYVMFVFASDFVSFGNIAYNYWDIWGTKPKSKHTLYI